MKLPTGKYQLTIQRTIGNAYPVFVATDSKLRAGRVLNLLTEHHEYAKFGSSLVHTASLTTGATIKLTENGYSVSVVSNG